LEIVNRYSNDPIDFELTDDEFNLISDVNSEVSRSIFSIFRKYAQDTHSDIITNFLFELDPLPEEDQKPNPYSVNQAFFFEHLKERNNLFSYLYFNGLITLNERNDSKPKFKIPNLMIKRDFFVKMKDILENYKEITRKFLDNPNEITLKAFLDFLFLDMKTYIGKMASFETGIQATIEGVVKTYTEYCKLRGISVLKHDFEKRMPRTGEDNPGRTDHTVEVEVHVPNDAQTKILKKN